MNTMASVACLTGSAVATIICLLYDHLWLRWCRKRGWIPIAGTVYRLCDRSHCEFFPHALGERDGEELTQDA
jgi:hypothetical protein